MDGNSFLNSFMPTLPWWFLVLTLTVLASWLTLGRLHLWKVQQRRIDNPRRALRQAKDALATVIADPAIFGDARDQALSAYDSVTDALNKEIGN